MKKLIKKQNKEFTVLNLTDTHMDDALLNADCVFLRILNSTVESLVERVKPDLITITGDFAWGGHSKGQKYLVDKLDSFNIPWAPVLGNHDQDAGEEGIRTLESFFEASKYCIYEKGDPALGHGNYVVTVEEEITGNPVEGLIFMDSHRLDTYTDKKGNETAVWARLWDNQIEWYLKQAEELKKQGVFETSLFMHIPPNGYKRAFDAAFKPGIGKQDMLPPHGGKECFNEGYEQTVGVFYEGICCYPEDEGMLDAMIASNSTKFIFCGHDHVNNWMINYRGINFVYTLKTGCGCYWVPCLNGGTVIKLGENGVESVEHEYVIMPSKLCKQL